MYRAVTLKALRSGINLRDSDKLIELAKQINLDLVPTKTGMKVIMDGRDVGDELRTVRVTDNAHFVASRRGVRAEMLKRQRGLARKLGPLVAEGRDQGTVVFPNAQVKFFLDADDAERARRRYRQMERAGEDISYEQVLSDMQRRDGRDRPRRTAPLEVPAGAIVIDTSEMSVEQMVNELARHVERIHLAVPEKSVKTIADYQGLAHRLWYSGCRRVCQVLGSAAFGVRCFGQHNVPAFGGALLASNHQSFLDPMLAGLGLSREVHYMARDSLFRNWAFGWLIRSLNAFPVKRSTADLAAIKEALRRLKRGQLVLLFGEGTRTQDGRIAPLQPGIIMLARKAKVPVIPVVIDGAFEAWPRHHKLWRFEDIRTKYGQPMTAQQIKDQGDESAAKILWQRQLQMQDWLRRRYGRQSHSYQY